MAARRHLKKKLNSVLFNIAILYYKTANINVKKLKVSHDCKPRD
jgi:hypothetical protein